MNMRIGYGTSRVNSLYERRFRLSISLDVLQAALICTRIAKLIFGHLNVIDSSAFSNLYLNSWFGHGGW